MDYFGARRLWNNCPFWIACAVYCVVKAIMRALYKEDGTPTAQNERDQFFGESGVVRNLFNRSVGLRRKISNDIFFCGSRCREIKVVSNINKSAIPSSGFYFIPKLRHYRAMNMKLWFIDDQDRSFRCNQCLPYHVEDCSLPITHIRGRVGSTNATG